MSCLGAVSRTLLVKLGQPLHTKIIDISSRLFFVTYAALPYSLVSLSAFCHLPRSVTIGLLGIVSRTSQPSAALPSPTFCVCIFLHSQVVQKMATTIPGHQRGRRSHWRIRILVQCVRQPAAMRATTDISRAIESGSNRNHTSRCASHAS
jgi:hypothetical protein